MNKLKVVINGLILSACGCVGVMANECQGYHHACVCGFPNGTNVHECTKGCRYLRLKYEAVQAIKAYGSYERCSDVDAKINQYLHGASVLADGTLKVDFEDLGLKDFKAVYKFTMALRNLNVAQAKLDRIEGQTSEVQKTLVAQYMQALERFSKAFDWVNVRTNRVMAEVSEKQEQTEEVKE